METTNINRIESNRRFEAKTSWKRKEAVEMRSQIAQFINDNFNLDLPNYRKQYKQIIEECVYLQEQPINIGPDRQDIADRWMYIHKNYYEIINFYYKLNEFNKSLGALFYNGREYETYTLLHTYSKHRLDPVWNMRKSQLIRGVYRRYILQNKLWNYHPIHIVLTLPHKDGTYNGKNFYARELTLLFNKLRETKWWKTNVYGGEYGVEVKRSRSQGLHIHIHSFTLLYNSVSVNEFRKELRNRWSKLVNNNETAIIWAETLYFYQRENSGRYKTRPLANHEYKMDDLDTIEAEDGMYETQPSVERKVRIKTYIDREINRIKKLPITEEEKEQQITNAFLYGTLECIKYHFKQDALFLDEKTQLYDIELMNEILIHSKKMRLYSRFGAFYNEKQLNFNEIFNEHETIEEVEKIVIPENSDDDLPFEYIWKSEEIAEEQEVEENIMARHANPINPYTGEEVDIKQCKLVVFDPAKRRYMGKQSLFPYKSLPIPPELFDEVFIEIPIMPVREIFKQIIFGKIA